MSPRQPEGLLLEAWHYEAVAPGQRVILPDGCVDVILAAHASGRVRVHASALMRVPTPVVLRAGAVYRGFRLAPGARIDGRAFATLAPRLASDPTRVLPSLPEFTRRDPALAEALTALAEARDVRRAARGSGLHVRTLQRLVAQETGETPLFWLRLARARRAARAVAAGTPLADAAADFGFSDQAHLTRETVRFIGTTPGRLASSADIVRQLAARGYA